MPFFADAGTPIGSRGYALDRGALNPYRDDIRR
jgi:hypothetical protein